MISSDSPDAASQYGSGAEGSTDPPVNLEAIPAEPVASGLAENASILREQQNSAPDIVQNVNPSPFSSPPGRGRGSFRGRFRGTMANPYEFFDMHTRGGRGRFSSNRAHFQWESQNQNQHHNTSMEFNAANDTTFYNNHFPALQPIYRNNIIYVNTLDKYICIYLHKISGNSIRRPKDERNTTMKNMSY